LNSNSGNIAELFGLSGKVAIITGAASGLGRAFSKVLAQNGATCACWDRDGKGLAETVADIERRGGKAHGVVVDVANEADVYEAVKKTAALLDRIDVLINNAGISTEPKRIHEIESTEWDRVLSVNLRGAYLCSKYILPYMLQAREGVILNVSSVLGKVGFYPGTSVVNAAYSASKAGMDGLTRQLAAEYASENIRCNSIAPGFHTGTDLGKARRAAASDLDNEIFSSLIMPRTPLKRFGAPDDLLGMIVYLSSDASRYVTGQSFGVDGGWSAT
jgi:NAD(P)-dependent dehydrogenase (short-subunit alcohol dehydrogenase family)